MSCQIQGEDQSREGSFGWKWAHRMSEIFTWPGSMWDVLASRCCELGAAGELWGGLGCVLVPAVWTLEVFSRTTGGLLWRQKRSFYRSFTRVLNLLLNVKPAGVNFNSMLEYVLTCRDHMGFPLHSWQEVGQDRWSHLQMHQVHRQNCCNKNYLIIQQPKQGDFKEISHVFLNFRMKNELFLSIITENGLIKWQTCHLFGTSCWGLKLLRSSWGSAAETYWWAGESDGESWVWAAVRRWSSKICSGSGSGCKVPLSVCNCTLSAGSSTSRAWWRKGTDMGSLEINVMCTALIRKILKYITGTVTEKLLEM